VNKFKGVILSFAILMVSGGFTPVSKLCSGFLPENNLHIPVSLKQDGGITEAEFNEVLDVAEAYYTPVFQGKGATLVINRLWTDDTVNASANQSGTTWYVNMYGGLARHPAMNKDAMSLVVCHETGHHIGGAPKEGSIFGNSWATDEGGADYFSTLKCLRNLFTDADNEAFVMNNTIDPVLQAKCETVFANTPDRNLCMRSGTAGFTVGKLFQILSGDKTEPRFDTPDPNQVDETYDNHPESQCRLDTYYQGAICHVDKAMEQDDMDANIGACSEANADVDGNRPRCWFKP
jgi:hypothetical protein